MPLRTEAFASLRDEWNDLAAEEPTPFLTHEWFTSWWNAYGSGELVTAVIRDHEGRLRAAACLVRTRLGGLGAPANPHTGDWDVVGRDEDAREELWQAIATWGGGARVTLPYLREGSRSLEDARRAFVGRYRVQVVPGPRSPYLELPESYEALMAAASRNMRSQVGRRARQLEKALGELRLRTITGGDELDGALDTLFTLEASGWKARAGTAILHEPGAERLYRDFARAAAERGWLRVYLLEAGGEPLAGDFGIALGGVGFLLKTGFDEAHGRLSPGLVLRGEVLRASIEEGLRGYDFLGPDDDYKLRWTPTVRPRVTLRAFRGPAGLPAAAWHGRLRPGLKRARDAAQRLRESRREGAAAEG
ncbi:MAG TPA: GNAT family N-acetyltransferase [Solirubrobacteraceae bacterium]|jgi:CelD/BcsL family acetyltransferase involved in cellulose biosynthesis